MSFTSTAVTHSVNNTPRWMTDKEMKGERYRRARLLGKKGYVRLTTTHGDLNIELHCNIVPLTCENFLGLCEVARSAE